jgi:hypothetical protein
MRVKELLGLKMNPDKRKDGSNEKEHEKSTIASLDCSIVNHVKTVTDPL